MASFSDRPPFPERLEPGPALEGVSWYMDAALSDPTGVFREPFEHLKTGKGKMLRARLGIQTALDGTGTVPAELLPRLAAVELLHLATLVHDDILDRADTRRGVASLPAAFGDRTAVLAGDYLLTRCFSLCFPGAPPYANGQGPFIAARGGTPCEAKRLEETSRYVSLLSEAMSRLCRGEMLQQRGRYNLDLTVREYLRIISGKTGALFALSALTGAATAGYGLVEQRLFAEFGYRMGMLFQMRDDQLDLCGDKKEAGKDTGLDLKGGVVTLPVILAFQREPALREQARAGRADRVLEAAQRQAADNPVACMYRRRAVRCLDRLRPPGRTGLERILQLSDPAGLPS